MKPGGCQAMSHTSRHSSTCMIHVAAPAMTTPQVGGLTVTEQRTHFAFWCMLSAPLILGNDPRAMTKTTLSILTAKEIIAISQDPLARQAKKVGPSSCFPVANHTPIEVLPSSGRDANLLPHKLPPDPHVRMPQQVWSEGNLSVWAKPLSGTGRAAALLFNAGNTAADITLNFKRDLPELAAAWARDVSSTAMDTCKDSLEGCKDWAAHDECKKNPGVFFGDIGMGWGGAGGLGAVKQMFGSFFVWLDG